MMTTASATLMMGGVSAGCTTSVSGDGDEGIATPVPVDDDSNPSPGDLEQTGVATSAMVTCPIRSKLCGNDGLSGPSNNLYLCSAPGAQAQLLQTCQYGCQIVPGLNDVCNPAPAQCETTANCNNCVAYARCRRTLPSIDLTLFSAKKSIVNSYTPTVGAVAIIDTGSVYGHVAYVEAVSGALVTIGEGNFPYGSCEHRTNTPANLRIVGYYK
jgi:hypothetical protein